MKERTGEYLGLYWDGYPPYEVVRGHVTATEAIEEVAGEVGVKPSDLAGSEIDHRWARWVPAPPGSEWDMTFTLTRQGPGAFAVTLVYTDANRAPLSGPTGNRELKE